MSEDEAAPAFSDLRLHDPIRLVPGGSGVLASQSCGSPSSGFQCSVSAFDQMPQTSVKKKDFHCRKSLKVKRFMTEPQFLSNRHSPRSGRETVGCVLSSVLRLIRP